VLIRKLIHVSYVFVSILILSTSAQAKSTKNDQAPPPPAVPVPKVDQSQLSPLAPQTLEGPAKAVSGDRISIGDYQLRLYGIAAPDMGSDHGPTARLALDALLAGQRVKCTIFGKTPMSELLGQCKTGDTDVAQQLLTQGEAAVYRDGTSSGSDIAKLDPDYDTAEQQARQAGLGIWAKPQTAAATQPAQAEPVITRAAIAYILALIAVLTVPITMVSIWRSNSIQHERWRQARRYTMATGLAAEAEIIRAVARHVLSQIPGSRKDGPISPALAPVLTLPTASFWSANAERLELLPVEVTVPLLRFYALHEEAARKLALAVSVPSGAVIDTLTALENAADRAIDTIEAAMGIKREKPIEPAAVAVAPPVEPVPPVAPKSPTTPAPIPPATA
jgi:endonuclease YncB( thermonuclease family)